MGQRLRGVLSVGLLATAVPVIVVVILFDLSAIASIGSAVALMIFLLVTLGHLRIRGQTGANLGILLAALLTAGIALLTFVFTTLVQEPASILTLLAILAISAALDIGWDRARRQAGAG
jgi:hypothetical protein